GTNGCFARREGKLILPPIHATAGDGTYTWGEDADDVMLDLVNSVRFNIRGAHHDGDVNMALMSPLRDDIPTLPSGHHFIGVWSFDGSDLGRFDGVDLAVRYDDAAAHALGLDEDLLKLWEYDSTATSWQRLDLDPDFIRDTFDHVLFGHANGDLTYFAVSAPEPAALTLLLVASSALLL